MNEFFYRDLDRSLACLNRRRNRYMAARLRGHGLVGPAYSIILFVDRNPGSSQDSLAGFFSIDKGTVARLVKRLDSSGLIVRETDLVDRRILRLYLTDAGRQVLKEIHGHLESWSKQILKGFSDKECQNVLDLIRKMTANSKEIVD